MLTVIGSWSRWGAGAEVFGREGGGTVEVVLWANASCVAVSSRAAAVRLAAPDEAGMLDRANDDARTEKEDTATRNLSGPCHATLRIRRDAWRERHGPSSLPVAFPRGLGPAPPAGDAIARQVFGLRA